jgi:hypothetical protein
MGLLSRMGLGEPLGPIQSRHMATTEEVKTMIHFFLFNPDLKHITCISPSWRLQI